jgi:hypothetical protein
VRTWVVVGLIVLGLLLAWYLSFSASRLDRLHHRVEGARATLDAQLVRRAEAAIELATSGLLDPASGLLVAGAAAEALEAGEAGEDPSDDGADAAGRESAESDLSHVLRLALAELAADGQADLSSAQSGRPGPGGEILDRLATASHRAQLARRFHNQAVMDAQRVRRKRIVRWAHLAGHAALPQTFEIDDELPAVLAR